MNEEPKDIKLIFAEALEKKTAEERAAYLDKACGDDADLRSKVEALLKAHEEAGDFLEVPALDPDATLDESPLIEGPGTMIGRYELLQLLAEGGMGLVYLAKQKRPVRRRVALKIIKPGMDSKQVIARFEAERQALALLDHPNIAHVFDAGTTKEGRPYFVMEYVKGLSITKYCDEQKLNIEKRLELFKQACEGVQHAHQKGIIHRDLKPSNILVSIQGDKAVPKIIDFGIAKAITQPLTEKTLYTEQGQLLGTPEYMSPEQVDLATQDIDTRSDIYSLGVLLYVLLSGALPFDRESLEKAGFAEIQRTIREEEPPHPSTRLTSLGEEAKKIAESRDTQVLTLARRLHRELEWIPLKAMRKERTRRYRSASELADDIQNYLNGAPLIAGPETAIYRVKKFVRKHAGSVATVALVAVAIVLGLIVSTAMYVRAERALQREAVARVEAQQAEKIAQEQRQLAEKRAEDYRRALYFNHIALAESTYRDGNIHRVRDLLALCPADLRGWEWYRLWHISHQVWMTLHGHAGDVHAVAFSPDGKRIASASGDGTIKMWEASTGAKLTTLSGHERSVCSIAFSSDGKYIVSGGGDKTIKVWDAETGEEVRTLKGHDGPVWAIEFSPDGKWILSGGSDRTVKLWDVETGAEVRTILGHGDAVMSVCFSPDGKRIFSGSMDRTVKVWDVETGAEVRTLLGHRAWVRSIALSPDGTRVASGSYDDTVKVWDANSGRELKTLHGHEPAVLSVAFSPDGNRIVSGGFDRTIKVWDVTTGTEVMTLRGHRSIVMSVVFSPDGGEILSGSYDHTVKVWDAATNPEVITLRGHDSSVGFVALSPDGKRIVSGGGDGTIKVWDIHTGADLRTLKGHEGSVWCIAISQDGERIVSGSKDKTVKLWDFEAGAELMTLRGHEGSVRSVALSPDGKRIVSGSKDKTIKLWDSETGAELMTLCGHHGGVLVVTFSPDGNRIVSGSYDETIKVWDAATGAELMTLLGHRSGALSVVFSPDGKRIVSGSLDYAIKFWDAATGNHLMTLPGHAGWVWSIAFSPDGMRIISSSGDKTIKIWDATTGAEVMTLRGHEAAVRSVAFSPDGKCIVSGSNDKTIKIWESSVPAKGYGVRETARKVIDQLYEKHGFYYDVIDKLSADKTLDEPVREVALQIANARRWEDAEKLKKQSWELVSSPDRDIETYRAALEKAEKANHLESNDPSIFTTLGVAQYRVGAYEDTLETFTRSEKIRADNHLEPDPANVAFIAMGLHQLDRAEEARAALDRLRDLCKDEQFAEDEKAQSFLMEAEKLLAGPEEVEAEETKRR